MGVSCKSNSLRLIHFDSGERQMANGPLVSRPGIEEQHVLAVRYKMFHLLLFPLGSHLMTRLYIYKYVLSAPLERLVITFITVTFVYIFTELRIEKLSSRPYLYFYNFEFSFCQDLRNIYGQK